jgi:hypothetical protein
MTSLVKINHYSQSPPPGRAAGMLAPSGMPGIYVFRVNGWTVAVFCLSEKQNLLIRQVYTLSSGSPGTPQAARKGSRKYGDSFLRQATI